MSIVTVICDWKNINGFKVVSLFLIYTRGMRKMCENLTHCTRQDKLHKRNKKNESIVKKEWKKNNKNA